MTAAETIRALMLDGRARTPAEIIRATGLPAQLVRNTLHTLMGERSGPLIIRLASHTVRKLPDWDRDPKGHHGRGHLYRINPNCRDALAANESSPCTR